MKKKLIELENICKSYGGEQILSNVDLYINDHEFITILGRYTSGGRRIFAGRALYCLGVCYHAVKEKFPNYVIGDGQIFHHVYLQAYKNTFYALHK